MGGLREEKEKYLGGFFFLVGLTYGRLFRVCLSAARLLGLRRPEESVDRSLLGHGGGGGGGLAHVNHCYYTSKFYLCVTKKPKRKADT